MFRRSEKELLELERELLAVEAEEYDEEEYEDEVYDEEYDEEYDDEEADDEDCFDSDDEEENFCRSHASRYGRGSPKKFDDDDFFDQGFDDGDVLFRKDYKKAKRKKRRRTFGLLLLAIAELAAIGALLLWFMSWIQ